MQAAFVNFGFLSALYLIVIVSTMLVVLIENKNPAKTAAWLLVLIFLPAIGLILYYIFGQNTRRKGQENPTGFEKFKEAMFGTTDLDSLFSSHQYRDKIPSKYASLVKLLENSNDSWLLYGSDVEVITDGIRKFDALIEDLENARHHIHMEYFYFKRDETGRKIREILMRKAREGIKVRFLYENVANILVSPRFYSKMRETGVEVLPFSKRALPWIRRQLNYRDHRKIVVVDGKIGYTGGMNIGNEYRKGWRDTHLRIQGAGVHGLQMNFLHVWYESGGGLVDDLTVYFPPAKIYSDDLMQIVPEAPDSRWPYLLLATTEIVNIAQNYIYLQTPYYMPPEALLQALQSAALSGVDVRLMVSRKSDILFMDPATQSFYEESLRAGIRIYELDEIFSHAKTLVIDDYVSVIGSANLDFRSLELSFELNAFMYDEKIAQENQAIFLNEMIDCREVLLEDWLRRPWWRKFFESIMRLFSPLL